MGAYLSTFASCIPTILYATLLAGQYTTPAIYCEVTAVFTNTAPVDAYRGAGRPEATYVVERLVHQAAASRRASRRTSSAGAISSARFPYQTPVALLYDTGGYDATARRGDEDGRRQGLRRAQGGSREARQAARHRLRRRTSRPAASRRRTSPARSVRARGLFEAGEVRVNPTGGVTRVHRIAQSRPGPRDDVRAGGRDAARHSDRERRRSSTATLGRVPFGMGTYGSRSLAVGGTAIVKALDKIVAKGKKIAAHLLEAAEADIEFKDGKFTVAGTDRSKAFGEIALDRVRAAQLSARQARAGPRTRPRSTIRRTSRSRPGRTSARSRSIRTPAWCRSSTSAPATISATSSIR